MPPSSYDASNAPLIPQIYSSTNAVFIMINNHHLRNFYLDIFDYHHEGDNTNNLPLAASQRVRNDLARESIVRQMPKEESAPVFNALFSAAASAGFALAVKRL